MNQAEPLSGAPFNDEDEAAFRAEREAVNVSRLWPAAWFGLAVHVLHVALFLGLRPDVEAPAVAAWRDTVVGSHAAMAVVDVLVALVAWQRTRWPWLARHTPPVLALAYLLLGAVLSGADQVITSDTSPWLIATLAGALLLRLPAVTVGALSTTGYAVFVAGQVLGQPDAQLRLSNGVKGLSVLALSLVLAAVFNRAQRREFLQRRVIERQQLALKDALAQARHAAHEADAANQAKSLFLATMSHEIRTPMTGVLGVADLLARTPLDAKQRELLGTVQEAGHTLVGLINDLLDFTKGEAGAMTVASAPLDLPRVVDGVAQLFEPRARQKGVTLAATWTGPLPPYLLGDALRLKQVLGNLVGNAVKFTAHGRVDVRATASREGDFCAVRLEVVDTGPGMTPATLERLFVPYVQGDGEAAHTLGGTGLGLAIARQLSEAMGGTVGAHSVVGQGSTFHVALRLPVAPPGQEPEPLLAAPPPTPSGASLQGRVLLLDDNSINLLVEQEMLHHLGLTVVAVPDAAQALEQTEAGGFDAVVTDLHMPGMDGLEFTRRLRARPGPLGQVPVLVLSADVSPREVAACRAAGATAVLAKPARLPELEAALRAFWA